MTKLVLPELERAGLLGRLEARTEFPGDYNTEAQQRGCRAMLALGKIDVAALQRPTTNVAAV